VGPGVDNGQSRAPKVLARPLLSQPWDVDNGLFLLFLLKHFQIFCTAKSAEALQNVAKMPETNFGSEDTV
jgi:hypothetical protein